MFSEIYLCCPGPAFNIDGMLLKWAMKFIQLKFNMSIIVVHIMLIKS